MSIETIEALARQHAVARTLLTERVKACRDEMNAIKTRKLPGIKSAVAGLQETHSALHEAIDAERGLFDKPKTRVLHGIKCGLQKAKGKLSFANAEGVIKLIKKHFTDQAEVLINTKETLVKKALQNLPAVDLKKIGCTISDTSDEVFIASTDGEIDKLVDALLNGDAQPDAEDEAA